MAKTLSLACEACRKRKAKCSGSPGPCSKCVQSQIVCVFPTAVKTRRKPVRSSRRIDELDDRLRRIEGLLKDLSHSQSRPESTSSFALGHISLNGHPVNAPTSESAVSNSQSLEDNYIRIAPRPRQLPSTTHDDGANIAPNELAQCVSAPSEPSNRPPFQEAEDLIRHYLATSNRLVPLFEEVTLVKILHDTYDESRPVNAIQLATLNVVFALSHQSKAMQTAEDNVDHQSAAMSCVGQAMSAIGELAMASPSIINIQVLLGISRIWQSSSMPQNANMVLAMTVRQIYQLGMQKKTFDDPNPDAKEWRCRLLWIAYTLDNDYSLRSEQPRALDERDMDFTLLPDWEPLDGLGFLFTNAGEPRINYFRLYINLSIIASKIHKCLQEIQTNPSQPIEKDITPPTESICDLVSLLLSWKQQIPATFQPVPLLQSFSQQSVIALVTLYVRHFNCMALVHRRSYWHVGHLEAYKRSHEEAITNHCPSHKMCYVVARISLQLLPIIPQGNVPCIWLLIDDFVSAALILLTGIIYESSLNTGWEDFQLVEPLIANLESCAQNGDGERLSFIHANCLELQRAARTVLEQTDVRGLRAFPDVAHEVPSPTEYDWLYPDGLR